jgi:hypothetical protein
MRSFLDQSFIIWGAIVFAVLVAIFAALMSLRATRTLRKMFRGKQAADLESVILANAEKLSGQEKNIAALFKIAETLKEMNRLNVQKVGIVRFNPFAESGSNMSFSLALLDGDDNGVVLSALHFRDGVRVYAKPVMNGKSNLTLSKEEETAITQSQSNISHHS